MGHSTINSGIKTFLSSARECRKEVARLKQKVCQIEDQIVRCTSSVTGMPKGGGSDRAEAMAALIDARDSYYKAIATLEKREADIALLLSKIPEADCRIILSMRYVDSMSWSAVYTILQGSSLAMSERQMYRRHGEALKIAREIYNKEVLGDDQT